MSRSTFAPSRPRLAASMEPEPPGRERAARPPAAVRVPAADAPYGRRGFDFSATPINAHHTAADELPPLVQRVLASPGEPLSSVDQQRYAAGFGRSMAQVRVHHDALAAASADAVDAAAYAVGSHVVMGRGLRPGSRGHARTLAHELAHVVQQSHAAISPSIPIGNASPQHEREAEHAAARLMLGSRAPSLSAAPLGLARQPRLTIVDVESGLTDKQLAVIVVEAKKALGKTTARSKDKSVKRGVAVSYRHGLKDVESLVKRGDVLVYIIGAAKGESSIPQSRMQSLVHDIVSAQKLPDPKLDEHVKSLTSDLRETVDPKTGEVTGQSEFDPATSVSIVNIDLIKARDAGGLRAIAGDVLHEGPGHRALPRGYHNPDDRGVMSKDVRGSASEEQILFQSSEWDAVNAFLKSVVDDLGWNR